MSNPARQPRVASVSKGTVRHHLPRLLTLLLLLGTATAAQAAGDDVPERLREAYEATVSRRDDDGYVAQAAALEAVAKLRTDAARDTLRAWIREYGDADTRRSALLLGALVRYGGPKELDEAIAWVEARKDPLMLERLHEVVTEVRLESTRAHLRGAALRGATPRVKAELVRALGLSDDPEAGAALLEMAREENLLVRIEVLEALGRLRVRKALPVLQVFLRDEDPIIRDAAARALGMLGDRFARSTLERALDDAAPRVVESAARSLGLLDDVGAAPALIAALRRVVGKDLRVEDAITEALQALSGKDIHADPELWHGWWLTAKDQRPFQKAQEQPGSKTVTGPHYYGFPVRSSRVIFVLDISRSMGWNERLDSAKAELIQVLESLPATTRFNLVVFSDRAYTWNHRLTEATAVRVRRAVAFIRQQRPLSGTNTYEALVRAFEDPDADTVFFLSDGQPSVGRVIDPQVILGRVRDWNRLRRVRIHGVALLRGEPPTAFASLEDPERSLWFMSRLCKDNDGHFKEIR